MNERKHALVTGGCGFIGQSIVDYLIKSNYNVTVVDDFSTSYPMQQRPHLEIIEEDVILHTRLPKPIDIIFHLASLVGMDLCYKNNKKTYDVMTLGARRILSLYPNVPKVFFSSSCVYGLDYSIPVDENLEISKKQVTDYDQDQYGYATGKWQMEKDIMNVSLNKDKNIIIRPFNVIGKNQSGTYGMVVPKFIEAARHNLPITVHGNGNQLRCFAHVDDFTINLFKLIDNPQSWRSDNMIYNIGSPNPTSIKDLAELVKLKTASTSPIKYEAYDDYYPGKKDVQIRIPNIKKAEQLTGKMTWRSISRSIDSILIHENETVSV